MRIARSESMASLHSIKTEATTTSQTITTIDVDRFRFRPKCFFRVSFLFASILIQPKEQPHVDWQRPNGGKKKTMKIR